MQKRIIKHAEAAQAGGGLNVEQLTEVEVTSEDPDAPVEGALVHGRSCGWRASEPGKQTLRLLFHAPQRLSRISLRFFELSDERTQEFVLRWSSGNGDSFHEIVRQRWNFSPRGSTEEIEEYTVELDRVLVLELVIVPDVSGGTAHAKLATLRLA